jgi:DNA helicase HerA-like ATPase
MFDNEKKAYIAITGQTEICLIPRMANRHGLITGATGTGKTVTLQTMAETFSQMGVPVFAADVKGDLSGVAAKGGTKESIAKRVESYGLMDKGFAFQAFPVQFWDVFGEQGAAVRATIADMGPLLLSRLLALNDTQSAVLTLVFKVAADEKLEVIDLADLRKTLEYVGNNAATLSGLYGNISAASIAAIQRGLLVLEEGGAGAFFGEPSLNMDDLIQAVDGKGIINILAADKLMVSPKVYTTFLFWLLTKLFAALPEIGDQDKPRLVFFFDEAHLLFNEAPKALLEKIEQVVRLIRSKGVGVYFISQSPADVPDAVLGQLGNRVQHALRAYTPKDQKSVKVAAQTFRANPAFDTEKVISELGIGEALISFLDAGGVPQQVERAFILPPQGQIGPLDAGERSRMTQSSLVYRYYSQVQNRLSAAEKLAERPDAGLSSKDIAARDKAAAKEQATKEKAEEKARKEEEKARAAAEKQELQKAAETKRMWTGVAKSILVPIARNMLGALFKRR